MDTPENVDLSCHEVIPEGREELIESGNNKDLDSTVDGMQVTNLLKDAIAMENLVGNGSMNGESNSQDGRNEESQEGDPTSSPKQAAEPEEMVDAVNDDYDEEDFDPDSVVAETAFWHVEASVNNGFPLDGLVEIENREGLRWYAKIVGNFGRMLSLSWITLSAEGTLDTSGGSFFFDLDDEESRIFPVSDYTKSPSNRYLPPSDLMDKVKEEDIPTIRTQVWAEYSEKEDTAIDDCIYEKKGLNTMVFTIGSQLIVSLEDDPNKFWVAAVDKNVGGRLLLKWIMPSVVDPLPPFWLFYSHPRIQSMPEWKETFGKNIDSVLQPPFTGGESPTSKSFAEQMMVKVKSGNLKHPKILDLMIKSAKETRPELFDPYKTVIKSGQSVYTFPSTLLKLVPAMVTQLDVTSEWGYRNSGLTDVTAKVSLYAFEEQEVTSFWIPFDDTSCILPSSWAEENDIPVDPSAVPIADSAKTKVFLKPQSLSEFKNNGRIEVVHPDDPDKVCEAIIIRVTPPLIWSQISADKIVVLPFNSTHMFPSGWCDTHGYPLTKLLPKTSPKKPNEGTVGSAGDHDSNPPSIPDDLAYGLEPTSKAWCPRIYFNYKCFSGPSLSKSKLCNLPRFVGPGPVLLVMQEVISKILSIAYVPSRVLNELASESFVELLEEHRIFKTQHVTFKAKYGNPTKTARQEVPVVRTSEKIEEFCHLICSHIKCCFNLFGPKLYDGDNCPANCRGLTKSNKVLKKAEFYRQQALATKTYLTGNVATFDAIYKTIESAKSGPKGRKGKRPAERPKEKVKEDQGSPSGPSDDESDRKKVKKEPPKPKVKKHKEVERVLDQELIQDESSQSSIRTGDDLTSSPGPVKVSSPNDSLQPKLENGSSLLKPPTRKLPQITNPLFWDVDKVYEFVRSSESFKFATHLRDHEVDGPALLLLDPEIITTTFLNYTLVFTEMDLVRLSNLIARLKKTWMRDFRSQGDGQYA